MAGCAILRDFPKFVNTASARPAIRRQTPFLIQSIWRSVLGLASEFDGDEQAFCYYPPTSSVPDSRLPPFTKRVTGRGTGITRGAWRRAPPRIQRLHQRHFGWSRTAIVVFSLVTF